MGLEDGSQDASITPPGTHSLGWRLKRSEIESRATRILCHFLLGFRSRRGGHKTEPWNSQVDEVGKPTLYISYLEVAPWNLPQENAEPLLTGVGTALVAAAVIISKETGLQRAGYAFIRCQRLKISTA